MARRFTQREVNELIEAAVAPLHAKIAQLQAKVDRLEAENARLKKDSSTSSKPPSSDIVKPPPPPLPRGKRKKRRRGGQPNHPRHVRAPFPPEQVDHTQIHELHGLNPDDWEPLDEFRTLQQAELVKKLFEVTEHKARCYRHRRTGEVITAPFPGEVAKAGLLGTRLSALIGYQKGACHMSYSCIERFLDDVLHLKLCRGYLVKVVQKMSASLAAGYEELRDALPGQPMLNIDGTGHPENGKQFNVWGFHAPGPQGFTFFHIDPSKSADILKQFLGETFAGVVGCDYAGIGVGRTDWFRSPLPPNRTGGFPASGSPVDGVTSKRIERDAGRLREGCTTRGRRRSGLANVGGPCQSTCAIVLLALRVGVSSTCGPSRRRGSPSR